MYYKHSGHVSFNRLLVGVGMGIVSGFALAISYAYGVIAVPYDQLAIIFTCAFGGLLGAATGFGFVWGKVRNQTVAVAATSVISASALYLSWAFWVSAILARAQADPVSWARLTVNPRDLSVPDLCHQPGRGRGVSITARPRRVSSCGESGLPEAVASSAWPLRFRSRY